MLFNMRLWIYRVGMYGFTKVANTTTTNYIRSSQRRLDKGNGTLQLFITKSAFLNLSCPWSADYEPPKFRTV
jgi:hypothetical protein